jgi:hypothetical protein
MRRAAGWIGPAAPEPTDEREAGVISELAAIVTPIFLCAGIGFLWARLRRPFDSAFVTNLVVQVGTPFLVLNALTRLPLDLATVGEMADVAAAAYAAFALVGMAVLRLMKLPFHSYLPSLMFPNTGNMGLPLCLFAFGEPGLALAIVFFTVNSVLQFTLGVALAAGTADPGRLLRLPLVYAVAAALVCNTAGIALPRWLANTAGLLGGVAIPMMLLAMGVSLATLQIASFRRSLILSLARLLPGAAIGLGLGWFFALDAAAAGVVAIQCAMPVAVFNYLFAQLYRREPAEVAGMIVLSTLLSFVTTPLLLAFLLH